MLKSEKTKSKSKRNRREAYLLLRAGLGLIFCLQGAMQFGELPDMALGLSLFQEVIFHTFTYALPVIEVVAGIMLLLGFESKVAIISLGVVLFLLIGREMLHQNLDFAAMQSIYIFLLYWLFRNLRDDWISFDHFLSKN